MNRYRAQDHEPRMGRREFFDWLQSAKAGDRLPAAPPLPDVVMRSDLPRDRGAVDELGAILHAYLAYETAPAADQPTYRAELIGKVREVYARRTQGSSSRYE